jgi:hypothetical protein
MRRSTDAGEAPIDLIRRLWTAVVLACLVGILVAVATACSSAPDQDPSESPSEPAASDGQSPSGETTGGPTARVAVYFVDGEVVVPVMREVEAGNLDALLDALFMGPTEADRGALGTQMVTEIPADAEYTSVSRDGAKITVDVTEPFVSDGGSLGMRLRLAQLVFTATAVQDVESVLLTSDGETVRMVGDGLEIANPLTRDQYASVVPDVLIESPLPGDTMRNPMVVAGTTTEPGAEFILRLTDAGGTVVSERLVVSDAETGAFGVEVEYETAQPGQGTLYALRLNEDVLMGVTIDLE